jgi:ribose 5-phosphate isomerase B
MISLKNVIALGSDHAGFELKEKLIIHLQEKGYTTIDFGCYSNDSIDYPDYGHPVAQHVTKENSFGIVICGSGNGINMTVNKHAQIRGALCWEKEIAELARQHNNANILTLPARFLDSSTAFEIVDVFFSTSFEGGRHLTRINKIPCA